MVTAKESIIQIVPREYITSLNVKSTLITSRVITLVPKVDFARRVYLIDLTEDEKKWLSDHFKCDATPYYDEERPHKIWGSDVAKVKLRYEPLFLDLSRPVDFVKYKVIKTYPNIVAPSLSAIEDRSTPEYAEAQFYFLNDIEEVRRKASRVTDRNKAIAFIVTSSPAVIRNIGIITGIAASYNVPSDEVLMIEITKLAEESPEQILKYSDMKAAEIDALALVKLGLAHKVLTKRGNMIVFGDKQTGEELCEESKIVEFLLDKKNKAYLDSLRSAVANALS